MEDPRLWIPIPHMYGVSNGFSFAHCVIPSNLVVQGFKVELLPSEQSLWVTTIRTVAGQILPQSTTRVLESTPMSSGRYEVGDLMTEDIAKLTVELSIIPVSEEADEV